MSFKVQFIIFETVNIITEINFFQQTNPNFDISLFFVFSFFFLIIPRLLELLSCIYQITRFFFHGTLLQNTTPRSDSFRQTLRLGPTCQSPYLEPRQFGLVMQPSKRRWLEFDIYTKIDYRSFAQISESRKVPSLGLYISNSKIIFLLDGRFYLGFFSKNQEG